MHIPEGMLRQAVLLSERYITDRFLPDKAIDLIDEACSDLNLHDPDINRRMELKRDLENVTFERETLMSAQPRGGPGVSQEELDARYARIAELTQPGAAAAAGAVMPLGGQGYAPADHGQSGPGHRAVDQDPCQQDPGGGVPAPVASWRSG